MRRLSLILFLYLSGLVSAFAEKLDLSELVIRNNIFYKKFTDSPFSGEVIGDVKGRIEMALDLVCGMFITKATCHFKLVTT